MFNMLPLKGKKNKKKSTSEDNDGLFDVANLPESMDVYWKSFSEFIPEGVDFDSLTEKEKKTIKDKYRFSFLRPGKYQSITGVGGKNGKMYP
jgi:hypothetical protein